MTVLSTFLESSLNFLSNEKTQNLVQSGRKAVTKFELPETQSGTKSFINSTWSEKVF